MSNKLKIFALIFFGCITSCSINILLTTFLYGKKIVQLSEDINNYDENISIKDATVITISTIIKWNIIPAFLNIIIWGGIIYYIIRQYSNNNKDSVCGY